MRTLLRLVAAPVLAWASAISLPISAAFGIDDKTDAVIQPRGMSPEASRRSIRVRPGFTVELVASEPLVLDPIAFEWGADGRLWVVEMGDYPLGVDGKGKPGGVVKFLVDGDGDGKYDKATAFLDGLPFPSGMMPWGKGVLIACAPDILYAEDTTGDGKADVKRVLFTGFTEGNQQHRLNGFDLGLDGWVYGANGDSGGSIRSAATSKVVPIGGRDFRFRPDTGEFEAESGQTQYGRHRDDWGTWFGNNNPTWAWEYVLSEREIRRNPRFSPPDPRRILEPDTRLYPISRTLARFNDPAAANRVTSANSPTPYRDELFGPDFESSLFVSEPVHNLVHRMVLEPDGAVLRGRRAADEVDREFLASTDNWFRPTMIRTGPDGALWIADMYRAVIEHPEWIPDDVEAKLDLRAGHDQGRIYRVYPAGRTLRPIRKLDRLSTLELVAAVDSPNGWTRDTAQRLLLERQDPAAVEPLRRLAGESPRPKTRVQAVWTLQCLNALNPATVLKALADAKSEVRRAGIRTGGGLVADLPAVGQAMLKLAADPEPRVRLTLALALGDWKDPRAGRALADILRASPDDPWIRAAVLSSSGTHAHTILTACFSEQGQGAPPPTEAVEPLFAMAAGLDGGRGLAALVESVATPKGERGGYATWQFAAVSGVLDAAERGRESVAQQAKSDPALRIALASLEPLRVAARALIDDNQAPEDRRIGAARLLGRLAAQGDRERLQALLRPQVSPRLSEAAVAALARSAGADLARLLLAEWKGHAPAVRNAILDTLLGRPEWAEALISALEQSRVAPAEVDPAHRRLLLNHRNRALRQRAEKIFAGATAGRKEVLDRYRRALASPGDPKAGAAAFRKVCATCHRLNGEGTEVGPDLASLTDKSPESLLVAILDPSRAFEAKYTNFVVQTTDGRVLNGMVAAETANSVTLRRQEGKEDSLLRTDIEAMAGSGQSIMPEGVEKDLSPRDVADVIAYLAATGSPRKEQTGARR